MLVAALMASLLVWAAFVERIVRDPANHIGPEPLLAVIPFVVLLAVAWLRRYGRWKATRVLVTAYVVLSLSALVAMDRANVLVQYERWLRRGMPERPCGDVVRNIWACYR